MGVNKRRQSLLQEVSFNEELSKVNKVLTDVSSPREGWRKVEEPVFNTIIKVCGGISGKLGTVQSIDTDDAAKVKLTFDQLSEVLLSVRRLFLDTEQGLFEDEELTKRYYGGTLRAMMEVWASCCDVTVQFTSLLVQKFWSNTDEHKDLLKAISRSSSTCIKLLVLMANVVKHPVPTNLTEKVYTYATQKARICSKLLEQLIPVLSTFPNGHAAEDAVLDITTWMLYGLQHVATNVIKPAIDSESQTKDEKLFDFANSLYMLFAILEDYETGPGLSPEKGDQEKAKSEDTETKKEETKDDNKDNETEKSETNQEKATKPEIKAENVNDCLRNIDRLSEEYSRFSETWLLNGKVGVVLEDSGDADVTILFRPEQYMEVAKCSVQPCAMADRTKWLDEVGFSDEEVMMSDIYIVQNGPLSSVKDVVVDIPVMTQIEYDNSIHIKLKTEGKWIELPEVKQELVADTVRVSFKTNNMEAFVAYVVDSSDTHELTSEGSTYTSPTDPDLKITFQNGSVEENHKLKIKILPYDKKEVAEYIEKCPNSIVGIVAVSDAIEVRADQKITMKKNSFYQLPIEEIDDNDTQIVVIRYNDEQIQILDRSQCHVKKVDSRIYSVETKGVWCVAIARVKKIFLNMRDTLKREFQVMHGKTQLCNIVMMIDNAARSQSNGYAPFWIDCVDKMIVNEFVEEKKKDGFIEVRNSRSKDINMHRRENMSLIIDGQIKILDNLQYTPYKFTYLKGADNHLSIPIEVKRDQEKMPYATFVFKQDDQDSLLHNVAIPVRDLAELPTVQIAAVLNFKSETNNSRVEMKFREESARNILSHESLMCISRHISNPDALQLAELLGVDLKKVRKFQESSDGDVVRTNFLILCDWRGNYSRSAMVDFLESSLRSSGIRNLADVITRVRKLNRVLQDSDF